MSDSSTVPFDGPCLLPEDFEDEIVEVESDELAECEEIVRDDTSNSLYMVVKLWLGWLLLIVPFRIFHVWYWMFMYGVWYRFVVIPIKRRGGLVGHYLGTFLDDMVKAVYVPFFAWWFLVQYSVYADTVHVCPMSLFEEIQAEIRGGPPDAEALEKKDRLPYVLIGNHSSYVDGMLMFRHFGEIGIIVKAGLRLDYVMGFLLEELGCLFTDSRGIGKEILRRADLWNDPERRPHNMRPLLVFPEGTVTNGKQMLSFHAGAFLSGEPVKPLLLRYEYSRFDPCWVGKMSVFDYFERLHTQWIQHVHTIVIPKWVPTAEEREDVKLYMSRVRRMMCLVNNRMRDLDDDLRRRIPSLKMSPRKFVRHANRSKKVNGCQAKLNESVTAVPITGGFGLIAPKHLYSTTITNTTESEVEVTCIFSDPINDNSETESVSIASGLSHDFGERHWSQNGMEMILVISEIVIGDVVHAQPFPGIDSPSRNVSFRLDDDFSLID